MVGWQTANLISFYMQYCIREALKGNIVRKSILNEFFIIGSIYGITFFFNIILAFTVPFSSMDIYVYYYRAWLAKQIKKIILLLHIYLKHLFWNTSIFSWCSYDHCSLLFCCCYLLLKETFKFDWCCHRLANYKDICFSFSLDHYFFDKYAS